MRTAVRTRIRINGSAREIRDLPIILALKLGPNRQTKNGQHGAAGISTMNLAVCLSALAIVRLVDPLYQPSATASVGIVPGAIVTWETVRGGFLSGLVTDVEQWIADSTLNFGLLLKAVDESATRTARRFYSKDDVTAASHPRLFVEYTVVPEPATYVFATLALGSLKIFLIAPPLLAYKASGHLTTRFFRPERWQASGLARR